MIDARHFTEKELEAALRAEGRSVWQQGNGKLGTLIDLPGVGVVGHSTPKPELCESCAARNHRECTGYSKSGELCACDCREA